MISITHNLSSKLQAGLHYQKPRIIWGRAALLFAVFLIFFLPEEFELGISRNYAEAHRVHRRLVLLSWDGIPQEFVRNMPIDRIPHLHHLLEIGAFSDQVRTGFPAMTSAGHAVAWTGAWANRNGITANQLPFPISPDRTVLEYSSGFDSIHLCAEPIWSTAARQGLEAVVLSAPQAYPFERYVGKNPNGTQDRNLTLFDANNSEMVRDNVIDQSVGFQEANGWKNLPSLSGKAREFTFTLAQTKIHGLLYDSLKNPTKGYDSLILSLDKTEKSKFLYLRPAGLDLAMRRSSQLLLKNHFSGPMLLRAENDRVPVYFRLFELDNRMGNFLLYHSWVYRMKSNRPERIPPFQEKGSGAWAHGAQRLYREGKLGDPIYSGGDGRAEQRYIETVHLAIRQFSQATEVAMKDKPWDLIINYTPFPDEVCHSWYGYLDASIPGYDPEVAAKYSPYLDRVVQMLDEALGNILRALPKDAGLALISDHGMAGITREFLPNVVLKKAGLLAQNSKDEIDLTRTKIYAAAEGTFLLLNLEERKNGIVKTAEREAILEKACKALLAVRDPATSRPIVLRILDPLKEDKDWGLGGPTGGDLYYELTPGYRPQKNHIGEQAVEKRLPAGHHSLSSSVTHTVLRLAGPGIRKHLDLGPIRLVDLAPTFCEYMGIDPPLEAQGRVLTEAFE